jgi:hypothetical protein
MFLVPPTNAETTGVAEMDKLNMLHMFDYWLNIAALRAFDCKRGL